MNDRVNDREPRRRWAPGRALVRVAPVLVLIVIYNVVVGAGIDFGGHWDEPQMMQNVRAAIATETLLPHWYNYPSVTFWLSIAALVPELGSTDVDAPRDYPVLAGRLAEATETPEFSRRVRRIFLAAGSLTMLWVYLSVLLWRRRWFEALFAAAVVAGSFELSYHARWIAPDVILTQFTGLTVLALVAWHRTRSPWALGFAAVAAGLACGTKYTGGILLVPVLAAAVLHARAHGRAVLGVVAGALVTFAATYLASTPGTILNPLSFLFDLRFEIRHYRELGHYGYTIVDRTDHVRLALAYVWNDLASGVRPVSWAIIVLAAAGLVALLRERGAALRLIVLVPLLYVPYMCGGQIVLFVRNYMLLVPFLALLAARGAAAAVSAIGPRPARLAVAAGLAALPLVAMIDVARASWSVENRDRASYVRELDRWLADHPNERVVLSPRVLQEWNAASLAPRANALARVEDGAGAVAFYPEETQNLRKMASNVPDAVIAAFGPRDRNFAYYTSWPEPRLAITRLEFARAEGLKVAGDVIAEEQR